MIFNGNDFVFCFTNAFHGLENGCMCGIDYLSRIAWELKHPRQEEIMFGIGMQELILVLVVALIILGPKKLPDVWPSPWERRWMSSSGPPVTSKNPWKWITTRTPLINHTMLWTTLIQKQKIRHTYDFYHCCHFNATVNLFYAIKQHRRYRHMNF